jgi:heme-degrading monooxygenase HmoA
MAEPAQLSQAAELSHGEHAEHAEHIHLPGPSIWPIIAALGVFAIVLGLATHLAVSTAGLVVSIVAAAGWIRETSRQARELEGLEGPARYVHTVLFQYMSGDEAGVERSGGLRSQIDQHLLAIKGMPGFIDERLLRTHNIEGPVQVIVAMTWKDAERLADYEETGATIDAIVRANEDVVVPGSVQVYDLEDIG